MSETLKQKMPSKRLNILVIEDSDMLREMFHQAFDGAHQVYAAAGVKEGWALFLDKKPNIVFLDIGLPDGSGHDLARRIKDLDPTTYIVMATASHGIGDKEEAVHNHVDGFVIKPFSKKEINGYIERYVTTTCLAFNKK